jgi:signal transduction histidine kinase
MPRNRAESKRSYYHLVFQLAPVALALVDDEARILEVNAAFEKLLGYTSGEVAGIALDHLVGTGGMSFRDEQMCQVRRRDGAAIRVRLHSSPLHGSADRSVPRAISIEALALEADSHVQGAPTETALRERDEYVATVAHDLRQPLSDIKARADLLRRGLESMTLTLADGLTRVNDAANRMAVQLDDMITLTGEPGLSLAKEHRRRTDLVALIRELVENQVDLVDSHTIRVQTNLDELVGDWYAPHVQRTISNVLGNVVKYSPQGGEVVVDLRRETTSSSADWARIVVSDRGIGIPAEDLPRIFERCYRGSNVGSIAGSGVGLAGARRLIEQHGGSIEVDSQPGVGSTFSVRLPL